jgi:GT2 family glycosyltransferase
MDLSIIIVNYNVKYFLEQALHSVFRACRNIDAEVYLVDNNSVDGSVEMVRNKFPLVKIIENKENIGFSKANNQAIGKATGKYILLLNPDTVVEEDTFEKVISFMTNHPDAGGLGVKMIDGNGKFLPESKRGLPTPSAAFYKIFGLSALFPNSSLFGKYHLGYLDKDKIHQVEVLSGAFMLLRKDVLDKIGLLDENFFMYGEDIDLSFRIIKAGYKNYYFPETRIIHYKGESTKKSSVNYVFVFYNAMIIFAKKHFSQKNARLFTLLINLAIYLRATLAIIVRFAKMIFLPATDFILLWGGMYVLKNYWQNSVKESAGLHFPHEFMIYVVPVYVLIWLCSIYLSGGYDRPIRLSKIIRGIFSGTVFILVVYALLPESYRFSRALILLGTFWASVSIVGIRLFINIFKLKNFVLETNDKKRVLIVGELEEGKRVLTLLNIGNSKTNFIGFVKPDSKSNTSSEDSKSFLGNIEQLNEMVMIYDIREIIFCAKNIPVWQIINQMSQINKGELEYKIAPPESLYIIGSNSVNNHGDLYIIDINAITKSVNKRNKRLFDIAVSLLLSAFFPVLLFVVRNPFALLENIFKVLTGKVSWIGYYQQIVAPNTTSHLPLIKRGILSPLDAIKNFKPDESTIAHLNLLYAKDYQLLNDLNILLKGFRSLGRSGSK